MSPPDDPVERAVPVSGGAGGTDAASWEQRYREGRTRWDLGGAPPALVRAIAARPAPPARAVLVPGAGFGHDAFAWARAGHAVTAVDLAPSACAALRARAERAGLTLTVLEADVLALPGSLAGAFDLVWEQTCFCTLPPALRGRYVAAMAAALRPGGSYLGLLWNHGQPGGPPFDVAWPEVRPAFLEHFVERGAEAVADAVPGRSHETLVTLERR